MLAFSLTGFFLSVRDMALSRVREEGMEGGCLVASEGWIGGCEVDEDDDDGFTISALYLEREEEEDEKDGGAMGTEEEGKDDCRAAPILPPVPPTL